jgi:Metallo-beta-lactamase superfamily
MSQLSWDVFVAPELALAGDDLPPGLSTRTWGPVSATLIMGREDAVLVDALLTTAQATALAGWIQARGRNLTTVYVTHGHGDHFFGLPVILDRFPRAKAVALPGAIEVMREQLVPPVSAYYDAILPGQIPGRRTLPGPLAAGPITLDGHALIPVELGHTDTAASTCLHVPSLAWSSPGTRSTTPRTCSPASQTPAPGASGGPPSTSSPRCRRAPSSPTISRPARTTAPGTSSSPAATSTTSTGSRPPYPAPPHCMRPC